MEDAHIHATNIDGKGTSVFGIFDGHGGTFIKNYIFKGKEVAIFVERHFVEELLKFKEF
jgi:serine/threonine protein phosphatase PrpC